MRSTRWALFIIHDHREYGLGIAGDPG